MLTSIDFKREFIIDFDSLLTQTNNPLINSDEHYLQYKQRYIKNAKDAQKRFTQLCKEIQVIQQTQKINVSYCKFQYTFSQDELSEKMNELKAIISQQRKALLNFLNHIQFLNNNVSKISSATPKQNPLKDLFNKVFN